MVPSATPKEVVAKLQAAILRALDDSTIKQKLLDMGLEASGAPGAKFATYIDDQTRKWTNVIRTYDLEGIQRCRCKLLCFDKRFDLTC